MAMATELKMELWNRSDGSARCMVTSIQKDPRKIMNTRDYEYKYRNYLAQLAKHDKVYIIINSQGGVKDSAIGLMSAMWFELKKKIKMYILIDGVCASAATYISCGLKGVPVYITPGSKFYIHRPRRVTYNRRGGGPWNAMYHAGTWATEHDLRVMYRKKSRQKAHTIREWMNEGKWFNAEEAVKAGFCDGIMSRAEFEKL